MSNYLNSYDAAFVAAFDEEYKNAEVGGAAVVLDEGRYQFAVADVKIIEKDNYQYEGLEADAYYEHQLVISLKVMSKGRFEGKITNKYHGICLKAVRGLKSDLSAMGHEFRGLEQLFADVESGAMIGLILDGRVTKRTKGEKVYTNIWLDRCSGKLTPEQMGFTPADNDDELPWGK